MNPTALLLGSLVALAVGPVLLQLKRLGSQASGFLGGFTFITIAGLIGFSILPDAVAAGGWPAWVWLLLGLGFPALLEIPFHRLHAQAHLLVVIFSVSGLAVHAAIDGAAIASPLAVGALHEHGAELGLAVMLHRLPVGIAVWHLLAPTLGRLAALAVLGLMMLATVGGFSLGPQLSQVFASQALAWFQAFVAGSILHVIIYEPGHQQAGRELLAKWPDRFGLLCGLALLYVYL
jgi:hypothetical protein